MGFRVSREIVDGVEVRGLTGVGVVRWGRVTNEWWRRGRAAGCKRGNETTLKEATWEEPTLKQTTLKEATWEEATLKEATLKEAA